MGDEEDFVGKKDPVKQKGVFEGIQGCSSYACWVHSPYYLVGLGNMSEAADLELTCFLLPIISDSPFYSGDPGAEKGEVHSRAELDANY